MDDGERIPGERPIREDVDNVVTQARHARTVTVPRNLYPLAERSLVRH